MLIQIWRNAFNQMLVAGILLAMLTGCRSPLTKLSAAEKTSYQGLLEWSLQNGTPGAVLVVRSPGSSFVGTIGWSDRARRTPMRPEERFRIASLSKAFLGVVVAQLAAERRLDLDAPITDYLPVAVSARLQGSERISVRHLLRHTSGLYDFERSTAHALRRYLTDRRGSWAPDRDLKYAYDRPLDFEPGTGWRYSTSGYILLGMIVDQIAGRHHSFEIRDRILKPLGLHDTYCELTEHARGSRARGYENWWGWGWTDATDWAPMTGAMVSSARDLANFVRAVVRSDAFLDEATRQVMWGDREKGHLRYDFGISLLRTADDSPWLFGHFGAGPGYLSFAFHQPEEDITIVFLANTSHLSAPNLEKRRAEFSDTLAKALFRLALSDGRSAK